MKCTFSNISDLHCISGQFTLRDMYEQFQNIMKMGPFSQILVSYPKKFFSNFCFSLKFLRTDVLALIIFNIWVKIYT